MEACRISRKARLTYDSLQGNPQERCGGEALLITFTRNHQKEKEMILKCQRENSTISPLKVKRVKSHMQQANAGQNLLALSKVTAKKIPT